MATQKFREHIKTEDGYDVVHRESQADLILDTKNDGKNVQDHIDGSINSMDGAHGFRYNGEAEAFEVYNEESGEWEEVSSAGGGGTPLGNVTNIKTVVSDKKVYVSWKDPEDIVVQEAKIAEWAGTLLIRKAGSAPANRKDGTTVIDSKTRDEYASKFLCDNGLSNGVTYYYKFFPYTTGKVYTDSEADAFNKTPNPVAPANVSSIAASAAGNGKVALKWSDPANTVESGITVSEWAGTKVVYKEDDYPTSSTDGTLALNSTTRDQHKTSPLVIDGLTNGTTYYFSFFPYSTDGAENTNASNRITGVPNRIVISKVPSQDGTLTYNKQQQEPVWDGYDQSKMTIGGETYGTNAKTYQATFEPKDDYCWSLTDTAKKTVPWVIGKANCTATYKPDTVSLGKDKLSETVVVTTDFDGTINAVSKGTSIATVQVAGKNVTISSVQNTTGDTTVEITFTGGSNYNPPDKKVINVTAKFTTVYGVTWDGTSSTKLTRTDAASGFVDPTPAVGTGTGSSPFDKLLPWSGMVKDTSDANAGTLVKIPKFWYKLTSNGTGVKIQIADGQMEGFSVSPAHMDRGDGKGERDYVYVGRYHCATSDFKSKTGEKPKASVTRSSARSSIKALGTCIYQSDFAMRFTIWLLYIVEFANWDSQKCIGRGCGNNSATENMGYTDKMTYHTGTTATNRDTYGLGTQYRWIEGLWDNVYDWCDGCFYSSSGLSIILHPDQFSDTTNSYAKVAGTLTGGYPSELKVTTDGGFPVFLPQKSSGSDSTYIPDYWYFNASYPCLYVGGYYYQYLYHGLFYVYCFSATYSVGYVGCRLQKLP